MNESAKFGFIVAVCALSISACSFVESRQLVGSEPVNPDVRNGTSWVNPDGDVMTITFDDKEPGRLRMTSKDDGSNEMIGYLRKTEDWLFLNFSSTSDDGEVEQWLWYVVKLSDDGKYFFFWTPSTDEFAKLVRDGRVKGSVEEAESEEKVVQQSDGVKTKTAAFPSMVVTIDDPEGQWVEDLVSGKLGVPIQWQNPILWRRVEANAEGGPNHDSSKEAENDGADRPVHRSEPEVKGDKEP